MRSLHIVFVVALSVAAGCSQQTVSSPAPSAALAVPRVHAGVTFTTIYSFKGAPDGSIPEAGLTLIADTFYGTTTGGGTAPHNDGTVYSVKEDGTEHVLHSFTYTPDGSSPEAGLTSLNKVSMYGTTSGGGEHSAGTVYEIKTDGSERVIYSFKCNLKTCDDGANPSGDMTLLNGRLYGTTGYGGANGDGIVFEMHTDGTERIVYSFAGMPDGDVPHGGMAQLNGDLYGTTEHGGANGVGCVFKVHPDGTEKVLYSFKGASSNDGAAPLAGLTVLNGLLYGVTSKGGAKDDGTVFEVHSDGTERVIHSFAGTDGQFPYAGLTVLNGLLYGTTIRGGANDMGTVFEVHADGTHRVLHEFNGTDGKGPDGALAVRGTNKLVGTTRRGGESNNGTVFAVQL